LAKILPEPIRRVGGTLFATEGFKPVYLTNTAQLISHVEYFAAINWTKGARFTTQERLFENRRMKAEAFESIELVPHTPSVPGVFYLHPELPGVTPTSRVDELVGFFKPSSEVDRQLMKAAIMTPSWGGAAGKRPAILVTGPDDDGKRMGRGVGKSTFVDVNAIGLYGETIDITAKDEMKTIVTRILSPGGATKRILRMDNIKTHRLSWDDLEKLITSPSISGHLMYAGESHRKNLLTVFMTLNGANLSKDLAQRVVVIKLARPEHHAHWEDDVRRFIKIHRWEILAEIAAILSREPGPLIARTRWAEWESAVLSKLDWVEECQDVIVERQGLIDDDDSDRDLVREFIKAQLTRQNICPETESVLIQSVLMAEWIEKVRREKMATNRASGFVKGLGIPELKEARKSDFRGFEWRGLQCNWPATRRLYPENHEPKNPGLPY